MGILCRFQPPADRKSVQTEQHTTARRADSREAARSQADCDSPRRAPQMSEPLFCRQKVLNEVLLQPQRFLEEFLARMPSWEAYGKLGAPKPGLGRGLRSYRSGCLANVSAISVWHGSQMAVHLSPTTRRVADGGSPQNEQRACLGRVASSSFARRSCSRSSASAPCAGSTPPAIPSSVSNSRPPDHPPGRSR